MKRRPRKVIPGHWSGWAHLRRVCKADRRIQAPPKRIGNEDAKAALKRAECPYVIKDKRGNLAYNLCF